MHILLRRLKAFVVITLLWGLLSGVGAALIGTVIDLVRGASIAWLWSGFVYMFKFGALLGLAFGAIFTLTLGLLGRFFRSGRVPTWVAALIGGIGAPVGGMILLTSVHSVFLGPTLVAAMAGLGLLIGGGIGAVTNHPALPPGAEPEQLPSTTS